jgi:hypothetical protein
VHHRWRSIPFAILNVYKMLSIIIIVLLLILDCVVSQTVKDVGAKIGVRSKEVLRFLLFFFS